jgi:hypothetical protein
MQLNNNADFRAIGDFETILLDRSALLAGHLHRDRSPGTTVSGLWVDQWVSGAARGRCSWIWWEVDRYRRSCSGHGVPHCLAASAGPGLQPVGDAPTNRRQEPQPVNRQLNRRGCQYWASRH